MRFRMLGADRITGAERELLVVAPDADAAAVKANAQGLLVADCVALDNPVQAADTKVCSFCVETINAKAIKCRWCGEMWTIRLNPRSLRPGNRRRSGNRRHHCHRKFSQWLRLH